MGAVGLAGRIAIGVHPDVEGTAVRDPLDLRADEGVIVALES